MAMANHVPSTNELIQAEAHVWNSTVNIITQSCLRFALDLGILDIIHNHGKPIKLSNLISALSGSINKVKSIHLARVMRVLVNDGFLVMAKIHELNSDEEEEEGYCLTTTSRILLRDEPLNIVSFSKGVIDPILQESLFHLSEWFNDQNSTPFCTTHGVEMWEYASHNPRFNETFNEAMASDSRFVSSIFVSDHIHILEGLASVVDIGGGRGIMTMAIVNALPHMKGIVLDLPHVVDGLEDTNNLTYVGGDMFESIPHADAVLIKWILHNWSDEECVALLKKCREAIPSKEKRGKVIIIEIVFDDKSDNPKAIQTQLHLDILMMTQCRGKERTEKEFENLFFHAGFTSYKITTQAIGFRSIIEVFP